jgi:hypothetical protein
MRNKSHLEEISNALFGSPEDLSLEDALETLKLAEISPEELCDRTYNELLFKARAYRTRQEEVPPRLKKALEDLRPVTVPPRSQEELDRSASATVSRIIDAVRGFKLSSSSRKIAEDVYQSLGSGFSEDVYDRAMQVGLRLEVSPMRARKSSN